MVVMGKHIVITSYWGSLWVLCCAIFILSMLAFC